MQPPKVSVIIPLYNVERYLRECLDSIVSQTLKDIEIILVNDCSTDNSGKIALEYASLDRRIVYIEHETNKRQGSARNTGIRAAKGEWLCFVDSDDTIAPYILQKTISECTQRGANFGVFGIMEYNTGSSKRSYWAFPPKNITKRRLGPHSIGALSFSPCARIYKRLDLVDNHIFFPENIFFEDWVFYYYYTALVRPKITVVREYGYFYRRHENSTVGQVGNSNGVYYPLAAHNIAEFLQKEGLWEEYSSEFFKDIPMRIGAAVQKFEDPVMEQFLKNFRIFCQVIEPSPKNMEQFPLLCFASLDSMPLPLQKALFCALIKIQSDKWYRFGQQGIKGKAAVAFSFVLKKLRSVVSHMRGIGGRYGT